jgi:Stage II sporulation protein M
MQFMKRVIPNIVQPIARARLPILTIAAAYWISILVGMIMVHSGNSFALNYRDKLVENAARQNLAAIANNQGYTLKAALFDFAGNLFLGSVPKSIMGMGIIFPYPWVAHQGWIGGIVSVRGDHTSRLNNVYSAIYYLLTLTLQITAYSLAIGAGVNVGVSLFWPAAYYQGEKLAGLFPKEVLRDFMKIYLLAVPIFFVASLWEFFSRWNI